MKNYTVELLSFDDRAEWNSLLSRLQLNDVYFSAEYLKANESLLGGIAECFVIKYSDSMIVYPYIKRGIVGSSFFDISTPYGFGGYLSDLDQGREDFEKEFSAYCLDAGIISEFVRFHPLINNQRLAQGSSLQVKFRQPVVQLDFTKTDFDLRNSVKKEVIRKLKKAANHHIEAVKDSEFRFYQDFINLYHETMDNKNAAAFYFFEERFFSELRNFLGDKMALFVCVYNESVIGGLLILFNEKYAYNFLSCSKREYLSLGTNDMLQFAALDWAYNMGKEKYLLGGGLSGEDSLFQYKSRFSPDRSGFYIGNRIHAISEYHSLCEKTRKRQNATKEEFYARTWFPLYRSDAVNTDWRINDDHKYHSTT